MRARIYLCQAMKPGGNKKKERKGLFVAAWLILLAGITALTGALAFKKKNDLNNKPKDKIEKEIETDDISLADLGALEEIVNPNEKIYGETTGDVDKKQVVKKDGTIWKNQAAADKSNQVGKTTIDDKNGTLTVKPNGTVVEKDKNYEVKDETGKVTQSGTNESGIPSGYVWDKDLNAYVPANEVGLYIYADATYYNTKGDLVVNKGDKVLKTTLETIKKTCTTTKAETNNTTTTTPSTDNTTNNNTEAETVIDEGKINEDGTYTIYGVTYMDKATFEAILLEENNTENFGYYNGVIYPKSVINEMSAQNQKTK